MNTCMAPQFALTEKKASTPSVTLSSLLRLSTLTLVFAYVSFPIWGAWLANYDHLHTVSPQDLLLMMCWMPVSAGILGLSFIKNNRPISLRLLVFCLLNCCMLFGFYSLDLI